MQGTRKEGQGEDTWMTVLYSILMCLSSHGSYQSRSSCWSLCHWPESIVLSNTWREGQAEARKKDWIPHFTGKGEVQSKMKPFKFSHRRKLSMSRFHKPLIISVQRGVWKSLVNLLLQAGLTSSCLEPSVPRGIVQLSFENLQERRL